MKTYLKIITEPYIIEANSSLKVRMNGPEGDVSKTIIKGARFFSCKTKHKTSGIVIIIFNYD